MNVSEPSGNGVGYGRIKRGPEGAGHAPGPLTHPSDYTKGGLW